MVENYWNYWILNNHFTLHIEEDKENYTGTEFLDIEKMHTKYCNIREVLDIRKQTF